MSVAGPPGTARVAEPIDKAVGRAHVADTSVGRVVDTSVGRSV